MNLTMGDVNEKNVSKSKLKSDFFNNLCYTKYSGK